MQETIINPTTDIYPATEDYVHALSLTGADQLLFVSGTMGLDPQSKAPDKLEDQLKLVWENLFRILEEAQMSSQNIMRITSYLRQADYAAKNQQARLAALGSRLVPATAIVVETLRPDWLVEIEIIAAA